LQSQKETLLFLVGAQGQVPHPRLEGRAISRFRGSKGPESRQELSGHRKAEFKKRHTNRDPRRLQTGNARR